MFTIDYWRSGDLVTERIRPANKICQSCWLASFSAHSKTKPPASRGCLVESQGYRRRRISRPSRQWLTKAKIRRHEDLYWLIGTPSSTVNTSGTSLMANVSCKPGYMVSFFCCSADGVLSDQRKATQVVLTAVGCHLHRRCRHTACQLCHLYPIRLGFGAATFRNDKRCCAQAL